MTIRDISSKRDIRAFARFPVRLYKNCSQFVPALIGDEIHTLMHSPCLDYCKLKLFLAYDDAGCVVGRIAGIINPRANELYNYRRVRFGWFDFVEDFEVAKALIEAVKQWGLSMGMNQMHGPLGFNSWNRQGMLVDGFENRPQFNCLYNFPYYIEYMERLGFSKEVDWIQYIMKAAQDIPEKVERINSLLLRKYKLHILDWKKPSELSPYLDDFFATYNDSFMTVHNFIPLTKKEIKASIGVYIRFMRPELCTFVMTEDNKVAAFAITIPSLSEAFCKTRGRILPFGWIHILRALRHYKDIDLMLNGAAPEWKGKGLSSIYHYKLNVNAVERNIRWAISNPQIETNQAVEIWKSYDVKPYMRRRCLIMDIN